MREEGGETCICTPITRLCTSTSWHSGEVWYASRRLSTRVAAAWRCSTVSAS